MILNQFVLTLVSCLLLVSAAWIVVDNIHQQQENIMENDEDLTFEIWENKFAVFEEVLRNFKSRHCILIECDDNQFNGQKKKLQSWELLSSPVEGFDSV